MCMNAALNEPDLDKVVTKDQNTPVIRLAEMCPKYTQTLQKWVVEIQNKFSTSVLLHD